MKRICRQIHWNHGKRFSSSILPVRKTEFHRLHVELGGRMTPFAGYSMPIEYKGAGVLKEHQHTRSKGCASLFDVSHMGQIQWLGRDAVEFLEQLVVGDLRSLGPGEARLTLLVDENGGIVDDTVVTNAGDHLYMVVNGACKEKDMQYFHRHLEARRAGMDVRACFQANASLLALQGDGARTVMSRLAPDLDLKKMNFMTGSVTTVAGLPDCRVTRCGYTGEDGFEIAVNNIDAEPLATALLEQPEVKPAGLGARDSLRLEAGLCLYGSDIDETTNPVEAGLAWTIGGPSSRRRTEQGFLGAEKFLEPSGKLKSVSRKRVGITGMKAPARAGTEIYCSKGESLIGKITSGGFGPSVGAAIAMGYIASDHALDSKELQVKVRDKMYPAKVCKMPFHPTNYYRTV